MKESFYFHDDTVILNYSKQYVTSKHGIIHTDVFDAFLDGFLVYLEKIIMIFINILKKMV